MKHCVVLLSGGLDSLLALKLMTVQGIRATALHSVHCFHGTQNIEEKKTRLAQKATELGAGDILFPNITEEVVRLTKNPEHGYGKHLNACIDCRLHTVKTGFDAMKTLGADFVVTGEVVGQRPMSQRRDAMGIADKNVANWGFGGLLLRPLCAKLTPVTIPEKQGWVDPERLYDIAGRGRDRQMALAVELGIGEYPGPGGGCLLTDPGFSQRLAVLFKCKPDWSEKDVELLKVGRHFQISEEVKIVASRCEEENFRLRELAELDDMFFIASQRHGAVVMLRGGGGVEEQNLAGGIAVHYSKMREDGGAEVEAWRIQDGEDVPCKNFWAGVVNPDALREMEGDLLEADLLKQMKTRYRRQPKG